MTPEAFRELRRLPGKEIKADIEFVQVRQLPDYVVVFENAVVHNALGIDVFAGGQFNRKLNKITYYFMLRVASRHICRIDIRGQNHGDAGVSHKHEFTKSSDLENDLPVAVARPDLHVMTPRQIWETICQQSRIDHTGNFVDP